MELVKEERLWQEVGEGGNSQMTLWTLEELVIILSAVEVTHRWIPAFKLIPPAVLWEVV